MVIFLNKKSVAAISLTIVLLIGIIIFIINNVTQNTTNMPVTNKVVALDAGHGGIDPGAVNGVVEKEINLKIALKLRSLLEESGAFVILTREEDEGLYSNNKESTVRQKFNENLKKRKELVVDSKADVFVSIHLNSFPQEKYYGAQSFFPAKDETSKKLALCIQEELKRVLDKNNVREPKPRNDLYLLKNIKTPTTLVECGFLSNQREKELLKNEKYQDKIAWAIYLGIQKYFLVVD